jgi:two-component system, chemotaxis family, CheB/CheR fusion protein
LSEAERVIKKSKTSRPDNTHRNENSEKPETEGDIFPVVGIGASAGGLSAFTKLLKVLPIDTGMAFVLVQHLDPKHVSLLPELMKRATSMLVIEVTDGLRVEPDHIYVMPPNHSLALLHGVLHLMPRPDKHGKHLPIDDFLKSLAEDYQSNSIGVILSGTASDGTLGMKAIKAAGGITFAQSEDSAEYNSMPHSAISAGYVDFVLTPEEIARELARIAHYPYLRQAPPDIETETPVKNNDISKIIVLLRAHTSVDFAYYKLNTIRRRINRRMLLHQIEKINDYVKFLQAHPKELDILFHDILINVTSFFRDPKTLEALKDEIFPRITEERPSKQAIRIWVPACSSGEEAYSVAIVLFEFLSDRINSTKIQIFASDIDKQAIEKARQGIYPPNICENVEPKRLQRFFVKTAAGYQICKMIRDVCVFAVQNVTKDPPFSRLDLICCRNLLIYFSSILQKKVLHTFHYALRPNRFLILGTSETVGSEAELFSLVDKKNKIYIRKSMTSQTNIDFTTLTYTPPTFPRAHLTTTHTLPAIEVRKLAENIILDKYGPPGVIIDQNLQICHFHGQTGPYIEPSTGAASLNLLKMVRQELLLELRSAVYQAIKEHCSVRKERVRMKHNDGYRDINLQILPLPASKDTLTQNFLILFELGAETLIRQTRLQPETDSKNAKDLRIKELENELLTEREYMQSIIEEQEGTNEELQSANEEIQSTNEELQSTNEELETAKEELQSTNEELATIIEENENRNQELNLVNNDLNNLLASIDLAIVILRKDLCIRRFTPPAKALLNLIDTDIGRPIGNLQPNVNIPGLEKQLQQVIETIMPCSLEVQDRDGHWYALRFRPYRTLDDRIDGVVMIFLDIDNIKKGEQLQQMLKHEQRLAAVVRDSNDSVTVQNFAGRILAWNRRATEMYGYSEKEALQLDATELIPDKASKNMRMLIERLRHGETVPPCESWRRNKDGKIIKVWLTTSVLRSEAGIPSAIAITEREINEAKE